jgi:hypothetical protein
MMTSSQSLSLSRSLAAFLEVIFSISILYHEKNELHSLTRSCTRLQLTMFRKTASIALYFGLFIAVISRTSALRAPLRFSSSIVKSNAFVSPLKKNHTCLQMSTSTSEITVISQASEDEIKKMGCKSWPTWGCGVSKFPWTYGESETW